MAGLGTSTGSTGITIATTLFTAFCTGFVESANTTNSTSPIWKPNDIMNDFFWLP